MSILQETQEWWQRKLERHRKAEEAREAEARAARARKESSAPSEPVEPPEPEDAGWELDDAVRPSGPARSEVPPPPPGPPVAAATLPDGQVILLDERDAELFERAGSLPSFEDLGPGPYGPHRFRVTAAGRAFGLDDQDAQA